jgi:hypothetical protein
MIQIRLSLAEIHINDFDGFVEIALTTAIFEHSG